MRFSTTFAPMAVQVLAPSATVIEREHGLTLFTIPERDAATAIASLGIENVHPGWPHGLATTPRGFATASAHIRR